MRSAGLIAFLAIFNLRLSYCNVADTSKELSQIVAKFEEKFVDIYKKLESDNSELKEKIADQERVIEQLTGRLTDLDKRRPSRKISPVVRKGRQEETVAFTAYLDHELTNLGPDHTIPFGAVELNEGNAYNNHTGIFTVPTDGLYLFSFAVEDYHGHRLWTKLVVDGQLKASVIEWPDPGHNAQGSNTAVLRLTSGQSVWVAVDSRESGDSLQGWANLRSTTFTGKDIDVSGLVDVYKQSLSDTAVRGRTQIGMMSARVANYCKLIEGTERFNKRTPFVKSSYHLYNRSRTCACDVPKAASTSIKRALLISDYPEKAELFRKLPGHTLHTRKEIRNVTSDKCFRNSASSYLVTRDPYTRLYSAYIDKIYLAKFRKLSVVLDLVHNKGISNKKIRKMFLKNDKRWKRFFCSMVDVSFEQFLEYIITATHLDIHYAPVSILCKPCTNHFDIILKQENLKQDLQHLFKTIYNFQNATEATFLMQDYIGEAGIESQIVTYYTHWNSWISTHRCEDDKMLYDAINRRLWNGLKLVGSIDENLKFVEELFRGPTREKYKLRKPETLLYQFKANKIPYLDSESRERQRLKFLKQAYKKINKEVIKGIQDLFQDDFILFDYDPVPPS